MYDRKEADARYRKKNKARVNERVKKWKKEHPEETKKQGAKYRQAHAAEIKTYNVEYRERTVEERKAYNSQYYKKHPEGYKKRLNKWRNENPERAKIQIHNRRTRKTQAGGSFTTEEWLVLCRKYQKRCLCCGKRKKLVLDHVVPVANGGTSNINNIQPLCQPCNSRKGTRSTDYRRI